MKRDTCRGRRYLMAFAISMAAQLPVTLGAQTVARGSFDRTVTVSGQADIDVVSGSGSIEVRSGPAGRVDIRGEIRAGQNWGWSGRNRLSPEERVRRLEANPPIDQKGNSIRVGRIDDGDIGNGVSITYTLTVPANAILTTKTGSGSQRLEGVRGGIQSSTGSGSILVRDVAGRMSASTGSGSITAEKVDGSLHASTGSGSIQASGVTGAVTAKTSSGGIRVTQTGSGDADVSSSSGTVYLKGVRGALRASTTSGGLHVEGEPRGEWDLHASSGGVHVDVPDGTRFDLDATTSSGRINVGMPLTVTGSTGRRSLRGSVGGGGPQLRVRTSSGSIDIR